ncbi:hypothetical protein B0H13DRAFT_1889984 [Mycena leptocephala]|nr:hypothetical protein B0H13DRAFT_1889984 [Mycena leptocephala]
MPVTLPDDVAASLLAAIAATNVKILSPSFVDLQNRLMSGLATQAVSSLSGVNDTPDRQIFNASNASSPTLFGSPSDLDLSSQKDRLVVPTPCVLSTLHLASPDSDNDDVDEGSAAIDAFFDFSTRSTPSTPTPISLSNKRRAAEIETDDEHEEESDEEAEWRRREEAAQRGRGSWTGLKLKLRATNRVGDDDDDYDNEGGNGPPPANHNWTPDCVRRGDRERNGVTANNIGAMPCEGQESEGQQSENRPNCKNNGQAGSRKRSRAQPSTIWTFDERGAASEYEDNSAW